MWIGIDWIDLRLFSYLLILVISEITLKSFQIIWNQFKITFKSFLSWGQFDFWSRYFQKRFFFGDFPKLLFWLIWTLLKRLKLNFSNVQTQRYNLCYIRYVTYRDCDRTLMTQPYPIMLNLQSSKMESVEKLLKMVFSVKTEETYTGIKIRP